jgi:pimeloyl-ACP methyl ester carboxylesterase
MALFDLPALVDHVLNVTGQATLSYVGHSEGTIQAFAGFSRNPTLSSKVNIFIALAPIAYIYHSSSLVFTLLAKLRVPEIFKLFGIRQFLTSEYQLNRLAPWLCNLLPSACNVAIYLFCGATRHINTTRLPVYLSRTPAGTSVKNMIHWAQQIQRDNFQMFDYGSNKENTVHYNSSSPPAYKLSDITVKTALFTGGHDILGDPSDERRLSLELPTSSIVFQKNIPDYAHLDFAWAHDANEVVYKDVVALLQQHLPSFQSAGHVAYV